MHAAIYIEQKKVFDAVDGQTDGSYNVWSQRYLNCLYRTKI